jgi:hypothetical protein
MVSTLKHVYLKYSKLKELLETHGSLAGLSTSGSMA